MRNGAGVPASTTGAAGDFYINTSNNTLFGPKVGTSWGTGVSLVGPAGGTGAAGSNGTNGTNGVGSTLKDANGVVLGTVLTSTRTNIFFQTSTGYQTTINWIGTFPAAQIYYTGAPVSGVCSGTAYLNALGSATPQNIYGKTMSFSYSLNTLMVPAASTLQPDGTAAAVPTAALLGFDNPTCLAQSSSTPNYLLTPISRAAAGLPATIATPLSIE